MTLRESGRTSQRILKSNLCNLRNPRLLFHPMAWLILLFVGSGCSALIYEIVWFQLLELVIGASAVSLAVLLATFMGGICLGSLYAPRISHRHDPLRIYAFLEIGIAISGFFVLYAAPIAVGLMFRAVIGVLCLMPRLFSWAQHFRWWLVGSKQRLEAYPCLACSTAVTLQAQYSVHCSPDSICFASTTWLRRRTLQWPST